MACCQTPKVIGFWNGAKPKARLHRDGLPGHLHLGSAEGHCLRRHGYPGACAGGWWHLHGVRGDAVHPQRRGGFGLAADRSPASAGAQAQQRWPFSPPRKSRHDRDRARPFLVLGWRGSVGRLPGTENIKNPCKCDVETTSKFLKNHSRLFLKFLNRGKLACKCLDRGAAAQCGQGWAVFCQDQEPGQGPAEAVGASPRVDALLCGQPGRASGDGDLEFPGAAGAGHHVGLASRGLADP